MLKLVTANNNWPKVYILQVYISCYTHSTWHIITHVLKHGKSSCVFLKLIIPVLINLGTEMPETRNGAHYSNQHSTSSKLLKLTAICLGDAILDALVVKTLVTITVLVTALTNCSELLAFINSLLTLVTSHHPPYDTRTIAIYTVVWSPVHMHHL